MSRPDSDLRSRAQHRLAFKHTLRLASSAAMTESAVVREQLAHEAAVLSRTEVALSARCYPNEAIPELGARDCVAVAVRMLCAIVPRARDGRDTGLHVATALHEPLNERAKLLRLAMATGAIQIGARAVPFDLVAHLTACGTMAARCALALSGRPLAPWKRLGREERASVLLAAICAAMRGGMS